MKACVRAYVRTCVRACVRACMLYSCKCLCPHMYSIVK